MPVEEELSVPVEEQRLPLGQGVERGSCILCSLSG
jgi:hypothetical protein